MFRRILLATDFSPSAEKAYVLARRLAKAFNGEVTVLHVLHDHYWSPGGNPQRELQIGNKIQERIMDALLDVRESFEEHGIPCDTRFLVGNPRQDIVLTARQISAHVIIMASHGHSGLYDSIIGATTDRVVRQSIIPVLVASSFMEQPEDAILDRILFPTDLSNFSYHFAESLVYGLAPQIKELHLVHVLRPPISLALIPGEAPLVIDMEPGRDNGDIEVEKRLEDMQRQLRERNENIEIYTGIRMGTSVEAEIMQYRQENNLHLIAMPASLNPSSEPYYIGRATEQLLKQAKVPVLVLK